MKTMSTKEEVKGSEEVIDKGDGVKEGEMKIREG